MAEPGRTTARVNLRAGPSTAAGILRVLPPDTPVSCDAREGDWLHVAAGGSSGWVHSRYAVLKSQEVASGFFVHSLRWERETLDPPAERLLRPAPGATPSQRAVARTWNRTGALLEELSARLRVDVGAAVAVLTVESGGAGFDENGRLLIRFETHKFREHWKAPGAADFSKCFAYDSSKPWLRQAWRPAANQAWRPVHESQDTEWACFAFAQSLDDDAAKQAISMGAPQILGSNHADIGYESVDEMFDAFSASELAQIVGLFDFIQGAGCSSRRVLALQSLDFERFAQHYNGPKNAVAYGAKLADRFAAFRSLRSA